MAQNDTQNSSGNESSNESQPQQQQPQTSIGLVAANTIGSLSINGDMQSDAYNPISPSTIKKVPQTKKLKSNDLDKYDFNAET